MNILIQEKETIKFAITICKTFLLTGMLHGVGADVAWLLPQNYDHVQFKPETQWKLNGDFEL
jgi:hypothetical protein